MESTEYNTLQLFARYKWNEDYICAKCGSTEYKKGKKPFSRRCKSCDRDESVLVGTAFEGVKVAVDKIYALVQHIWAHCSFDHDEKNIALKKSKNANDDLGFENVTEDGTVSVNELLKKWQDGEVKDATVHRLIENNHEQHQLNVAELSRNFELEENTVNLLLAKIAKRLSHITGYESTSPAYEVFDFIANGMHSFDAFMGLLLFSMDENWKLGKKITGDGRTLRLWEPRRGDFRWSAM